MRFNIDIPRIRPIGWRGHEGKVRIPLEYATHHPAEKMNGPSDHGGQQTPKTTGKFCGGKYVRASLWGGSLGGGNVGGGGETWGGGGKDCGWLSRSLGVSDSTIPRRTSATSLAVARLRLQVRSPVAEVFLYPSPPHPPPTPSPLHTTTLTLPPPKLTPHIFPPLLHPLCSTAPLACFSYACISNAQLRAFNITLT